MFLAHAGAPHTKLYVSNFSQVQLPGGPKYNVMINIRGSLQPNSAELKDSAAYTYWEEQPRDSSTAQPHTHWVDELFVVRPHVQQLLEVLCSREGDQHKCEVAVCTAADPEYAKAICSAFDPECHHLQAQEACFVARAHAKYLSLVTDIPRAAVIMDDCPDQQGSSTVWSVTSQRHSLLVPDYVPACDQDFILSSQAHLDYIHKQVHAWQSRTCHRQQHAARS